MGPQRRGNRLGRGLAAALATTGVVALLASGGCELAVSDTVPSFTCLPGIAGNCPAGQVCIPTTRTCVPQAGTCSPGAATGCSVGMHCDEQTLRCAASPMTQDAASDGDIVTETKPDGGRDATVGTDGPVAEAAVDAAEGSVVDAPLDGSGACTRGVTCGCTGPADCDSGICANSLTATVALSNYLKGMNFCTQPCCTSFDCPGNTVCFGTGGGGDYCVNATWLGRSPVQGTVHGGASCSNGSECRSGLCDPSTNKCADTCCSSTQSSECATGTMCRYAAFPGSNFDTHETAWCGAQIGSAAGGTACSFDNLCQSGKCGFTRCEAVCRATTDCSSGQACSYGAAPTTIPSNKDIIAGCMTVMGPTQNGGGCTSNSDCQSDFCDGSKCTDVCATDADCTGGLHCRPVQVQVQGTYSVLGCE